MPPDMYSDAAPAAPAAEPEEMETPAAEDTDETSTNEATTEIPSAVMGGKEFKPGDEIVLEVVQLTENGAVVKYASEKSEGGESYAEPEAAQARGQMSSMLE